MCNWFKIARLQSITVSAVSPYCSTRTYAKGVTYRLNSELTFGASLGPFAFCLHLKFEFYDQVLGAHLLHPLCNSMNLCSSTEQYD